MSTHPNVILAIQVTPDDLPMKTMRQILADYGEKTALYPDVIIDDKKYHHEVMESDYNEGWQLSAETGSIVLFDLVTYGYGETVEFDQLLAQKQQLESWYESVKEKYHFGGCKIFVTANYW